MIFKSSTDLALDARSGEYYARQKYRRAAAGRRRAAGNRKRWRLIEQLGRVGTTGQTDGQQCGSQRLKCQQSHRGGTGSSHISGPSKKTTEPGRANGSIALIDPPVSPPLLPVGPAARCWDLSLQKDDQYRPLRPAATAAPAIIHFEAINAGIKPGLFIFIPRRCASSRVAGF